MRDVLQVDIYTCPKSVYREGGGRRGGDITRSFKELEFPWHGHNFLSQKSAQDTLGVIEEEKEGGKGGGSKGGREGGGG